MDKDLSLGARHRRRTGAPADATATLGEPPVSACRVCSQCPDYGDSDNEQRPCLRVYGLVTSLAYQRARLCVERLYECLTDEFEEPVVNGMLDMEWDQYLISEQRTHGERLWAMRAGVLVWDANYFVGDDWDLLRYIVRDVVYNLPENSVDYFLRMVDDYYDILRKPKSLFVTMDFRVGQCPIGSMMFELYVDLVPQTCRNFVNLCTGEGEENKQGQKLCYKGTRVHRIVKDCWIQCGDTTRIIGGGGHSSLGCETFPDECKAVKHDRRGVLSMCNKGLHTNQSQFLITLAPSEWMDKRYVAFGQVVEGAEVLRKLEQVKTVYETPAVPVAITRCAVLDTRARFWPTRPPPPGATAPTSTPSASFAYLVPPMPAAPPAIAHMLAAQGPKLWRVLNDREEAEALAAARVVVEQALAAVFVPVLEATYDAEEAELVRVTPSFAVASEAVATAVAKVFRMTAESVSVHDLRDVESVLCEDRFFQGLYSLTVPEPIILRAYQQSRDQFGDAVGQALVLMLARRAADRYPCDERMPTLPPDWAPEAVTGPLSGAWTGAGSVQTAEGDAWPWEGKGVAVVVDAATGRALGVAPVADMAREVAEELIATLDPEEDVLQDSAKWALRVGQEVARRLGSAGRRKEKPKAKTEFVRQIDELIKQPPKVKPAEDHTPEKDSPGHKVLHGLVEAVVEGSETAKSLVDRAVKKSTQSETEDSTDNRDKEEEEEEEEGEEEEEEEEEEKEEEEEEEEAEEEKVERQKEETEEEKVERQQEEEERELAEMEDDHPKVFDMLIGEKFSPGANAMLAYSALLAQELLKEIERRPAGRRPDLAQAARLFALQDLSEVEACVARRAREITAGGFQVACDVQAAAWDVAFKRRVRSALPPHYAGRAPGEVATLAPPPPTPATKGEEVEQEKEKKPNSSRERHPIFE